MPNVRLQSSDGKDFVVDVEIAKASDTMKTMLESLGIEGDENEAIPLPKVSSDILKKVIEWASYHYNNPPALSKDDEHTPKQTDNICSWDAEFLKTDQGTIFELMVAANYLGIKGLLDLTCMAVANMIKGKTPVEIREFLNIKNDFTPSEQEEIRNENELFEEQ